LVSGFRNTGSGMNSDTPLCEHAQVLKGELKVIVLGLRDGLEQRPSWPHN